MDCTRTTPAPRASRRAFTLVEMLVVITIISILAALTTVGVMRALDTAKQTKIKIEVDNLDAAFKAYKEKYGAYPPCDLRKGGMLNPNNAAIKAHVARAFPRYYDLSKCIDDIRLVVDPTGVNNFRPDLALVFWLSGFNPDPTRPFQNADTGHSPLSLAGTPKAQRTNVFFDFDPTRLYPLTGTDPKMYVQAGSKKNVPYIYIDNGRFATWGVTPPLTFDSIDATGVKETGLVSAYFVDTNGNNTWELDEPYANNESCQIIAAGLDDSFGVIGSLPNQQLKRLYPTGFNYDLTGADDDNVTNFCAKARLGDAKP